MGGWAASGGTDPSAQPLNRSTALNWSLLVDPVPRSGPENMALDTAMLRSVQDGQAFLRLYRWDPPCLSFGRNEPALTRYDRDRIERLGLDTVRRPTGGRAVWHQDEVTYSITAPVEAFGSLAESYITIHRVIAKALMRLGIAARLSPRPKTHSPRPDAGACFASPAGGEVVVNGRKLVGSAQAREGGAFLQQGSILLADGQGMVTRVTRGVPLMPETASLGTCLGRDVTFAEVAAGVASEAGTAWPGRWGAGEPPRVSGELLSHYRDASWTWRR